MSKTMNLEIALEILEDDGLTPQVKDAAEKEESTQLFLEGNLAGALAVVIEAAETVHKLNTL